MFLHGAQEFFIAFGDKKNLLLGYRRRLDRGIRGLWNHWQRFVVGRPQGRKVGRRALYLFLQFLQGMSRLTEIFRMLLFQRGLRSRFDVIVVVTVWFLLVARRRRQPLPVPFLLHESDGSQNILAAHQRLYFGAKTFVAGENPAIAGHLGMLMEIVYVQVEQGNALLQLLGIIVIGQNLQRRSECRESSRVVSGNSGGSISVFAVETVGD